MEFLLETLSSPEMNVLSYPMWHPNRDRIWVGPPHNAMLQLGFGYGHVRIGRLLQKYPFDTFMNVLSL